MPLLRQCGDRYALREVEPVACPSVAVPMLGVHVHLVAVSPAIRQRSHQSVVAGPVARKDPSVRGSVSYATRLPPVVVCSALRALQAWCAATRSRWFEAAMPAANPTGPRSQG
jgi:hypothetical protein